MGSDEVRFLPYAERNFQFMTSSKIKEFERCQFCYQKKYVDLLPDPTQTDTQKDYFVIGQALDDLLTHPEEFDSKYEIVSRRMGKSDRIELSNGMWETIVKMRKEFNSNPLFTGNPEKKIMFHKFGQFVIKIEMDDYKASELKIKDVKSSASIKTFEPDMYKIQAALYHWIVEENTMQRFAVEYEVVDKYAYFSRSQLFIYEQSTLLNKRGELLALLEKIKEAHETGLFFPAARWDVLLECPYYGVDGHGRPTKPIYC